MSNKATNHVAVAMVQVATTSLPRSSHFSFPTTFFLVPMARCYFSLGTIAKIKPQEKIDNFVFKNSNIILKDHLRKKRLYSIKKNLKKEK